MYLIIKTGWEGIEDLLWLTDSPEEAISKAIEAKTTAIKELIDMAYTLEDEDDFVVEEISQEDIQRAKDFICIQKWNGSRFICACEELGIGPSKKMFR